MSDDAKKAEELLQQSGEQKLHATEAPEPESTTESDDSQPLEDAIADAYEAIDEGDLSSNLTLRDENLAALFHGLEETDQLPEVGQRAAEALERDPDDTETRAAVLRLLVRIGLNEIDKGESKAVKEGRRQFLDIDEI